MQINLVIFFLGTSILLYCLLGGADFGAGILELFVGRDHASEQKELITHAMGPVWEANHMWLVLAVVILFNGFPRAFSQLSITFHIPLTLMLLGIVMRGCAFTFRSYDAIRDGSQKIYSFIFQLSSVLTSLALGTIAGGLIFGTTTLESENFHERFVSPWLNIPSVAVGFFVCSIFAFLASVYLTGETSNRTLKTIFIRRAIWSNLAAIVTGSLVFLTAHFQGYSLVTRFFSDPLSLFCLIGATLLLIPLWLSLLKFGSTDWARIFVALQVTLVIFGWFKIQFPTIFASLSFYNTVAPEATLKYLLYALACGSAVIFPSLFYLLSIFKRKT